MPTLDDIIQPHLSTIEIDGRRYNVSVRIAYDGIEYVGRLWFADESWEDAGFPDRGALPGVGPSGRLRGHGVLAALGKNLFDLGVRAGNHVH